MKIVHSSWLILIACLAGCSTPMAMEPDAAPEAALGMLQARVPLFATLSEAPPRNVPIEASFVTYFKYDYYPPAGPKKEIHALIGPNDGEKTSAKAVLDSDGHLFIYSGFGYLGTKEEPTPQPAAATTTTAPNMSRPYLRTKRLRMTGEGSAYAVQATNDTDHGYFIDGDKFYAYSVINPTYKKEWLKAGQEGKHRWFVSIEDGDDFTREAPYANFEERGNFRDFLYDFTNHLSLPNP